ncbi:MAG TPA: polysaccharide deacetylase [Nitrolancea sp.]|nr:polysaccharide deacetylase [Nitrolancea sp.]
MSGTPSAFPVMIGFDLDGETLWTSRDSSNAARPVTLSQGRYGPEVAAPRILDFLERLQISATFFVPGMVIERYPDLIREIARRGHEIAHHGHTHRWPDAMTRDEEREDFDLALQQFDQVLGQRPVGYRSPAWEFSPWTLDLLIEKGIRYSSNFMDRDRPYKHVVNGVKTDPVELPVQWLLDDAPYFLYSNRLAGRQIAAPEGVLQAWQDEFDGLYAERERGTSYVLALHPQISGRPYRLAILERLIAHMRQHDVRFLRGDESAELMGPGL